MPHWKQTLLAQQRIDCKIIISHKRFNLNLDANIKWFGKIECELATNDSYFMSTQFDSLFNSFSVILSVFRNHSSMHEFILIDWTSTR